MNFNFNALGLCFLSFLGPDAKADVTCMGEVAKDHTRVSVQIKNHGRIGATQSGLVHIESSDGGLHDYMILRDDVSQYFEGQRGQPSNQVVIGLEAYVGLVNPVSINYVGTNFDQVPLSLALIDTNRKKDPVNRMIVWRGLGFKSNEQFYFEDIVCAVTL
jgi:hypothetical protein